MAAAPGAWVPEMVVAPLMVPVPDRVAPELTETAPVADDWLPLMSVVPAVRLVVPV